jgi:hypothetical protein
LLDLVQSLFIFLAVGEFTLWSLLLIPLLLLFGLAQIHPGVEELLNRGIILLHGGGQLLWLRTNLKILLCLFLPLRLTSLGRAV